MKKKGAIIVSVVIILASLIGCSNNVEVIKETNVSSIEMIEREALDNEIEQLNKKISSLENQIAELEIKIDEVENQTIQKAMYEDLTDLNSYEMAKYEEFIKAYDDQVLFGLDPISICKMYLYSSLTEDFETEYELYDTDEKWVLWTKEEHLNFSDKDRTSDFTNYMKVYNLNVDYSWFDGREDAVLFWQNESDNIMQTENIHIFKLVKENDIWKVCFLPIQ